MTIIRPGMTWRVRAAIASPDSLNRVLAAEGSRAPIPTRAAMLAIMVEPKGPRCSAMAC